MRSTMSGECLEDLTVLADEKDLTDIGLEVVLKSKGCSEKQKAKGKTNALTAHPSCIMHHASSIQSYSSLT